MKKFFCVLVVLCICAFSLIPVSAADFTVDFEDETDGATADETILGDEFVGVYATPDSSAVVAEDASGGNVITVKGFTDIKTIRTFKKAYTFSVDFISGSSNKASAVFVRGVEPSEYLEIENPKNKNVVQTFNYYEWDWYAENGGKAGGSNIGGSGIFIIPMDSTIRIGMKTYQEDGLTVATKTFDLPAPEGYKAGEKCNIKIEDTVTSVSIQINNKPFAVVELSEPGTIYETDDPGYQFYKKAVLKNAAGEEAGTAENTRICSEYSQIALTTRNETFSFDNVLLHDEEEAATAAPTGNTATPDSSGGESAATGSSKPSTTATSKATKAPTNAPKPTNAGQDADSNTTTIIVIAVTAAVVIAGVIVIIVVTKKKNKK